ncbi:hypothetical protein E4N62_15460 [Streptomyces sp. MNU76]|uniref:hypothetical protein n=1 Tax=Streptomyces sp. MNU76 TaxID=2560026 RepID=UPI001E585389|nr:hypothetical protein [Streptomyces sp. MNU76]MCC9706546.1 hypothetical protein [Streptomyces sp. MNU76]
MTDHNGHPQQQPEPRAWGVPQQTVPVEPVEPARPAQQTPPVQETSVQHTPPTSQAPVPAPAPASVQAPAPAAVPAAPQVFQADHAWVDGYEPGNPWQARLCMETPYGTFTYPLTPHTIPELLEQMVLVAQEQQGLPVGFDADPESGPLPPDGEDVDVDVDQQGQAPGLHGGRAARLTGWALVHDLWEREDPTARIVMGAVVVVLLLLGIVLT